MMQASTVPVWTTDQPPPPPPTSSNVSGGGVRRPSHLGQDVIVFLDVYALPLIALVGLVGNLVAFTVFVSTYMRRLSSSIYLAALCLANTGFLLCVLVSWAMNTGLDVYHHDGWCQTFVFLTYVSTFLSMWYVVSFTVERYIAVHLPLRRQELCTTQRAKRVVVGLAVFSALIYSFSAWMFGVTSVAPYPDSEPMCLPLPQYYTIVSIVNNVDTIITLILPFFAILIMNLKIATKVAQFYRQRRESAKLRLTQCKQSVQRACKMDQLGGTRSQQAGASTLLCSERVSSSSGCSALPRLALPPKNKTLHTRAQVRITKLLLIVSTIFLALNLPRHTLRMYTFVMSLLNPDFRSSPYILLWEKFFLFLYYVNFSVNLFLYTVIGKNFRRAFMWLLRRVKYRCVHGYTKVTAHCQGRRAGLTLEPVPFNAARTSALYL